MYKYLIIVIITILTSVCINAQTVIHNAPVSEQTTLSCKVLKPLSVSPLSQEDFLNWPTIPIGSKYYLNSSDIEDSDFRSIFTFSGEPNHDVVISMVCENIVDNVELSFTMKGTAIRYLGIEQVPLLVFDADGKTVVSLNADGAFYLHILYDWVWAKENATTGVKCFTQCIASQYTGL